MKPAHVRPLKPAAVLTVTGADKMSDEGRKILARWLRERAKFLVEHGDELSPTFTSRYLTPD